jgi:Zn-dependent metalloprotease
LLALLTAAGLLSAGEGLKPLSHDQLALIRGQLPQRATAITHALEAAKPELGLGMLDNLREYNRISDGYGRTHVRYHQTYRGVDVFNSMVLGHMDAAGQVQAPNATVHPGISLEPATLLSDAQIRAIVAENLPQEKDAKLWPMQVKPVVFPTKYQDGIKAVRDADGKLVIDQKFSVGTHRKSDPHRWAFRVSAMQATSRGLEGTEFVIDGLSGEILKKWDGAQHADPAAAGWGNSQYNGAVVLNTQLLSDPAGQYALRDTSRPTKPWPDPFRVGWPEWGGIGFLTAWWDTSYSTSNASNCVSYTNATNTWGDGKSFIWGTDAPDSVTGQTAAVDAHYGLQSAWDYFNNVLGRSGGIDGKGSSPIVVVHAPDNRGGSNAWFNAFWNPSWFLISAGDGAPTGSVTCLDILAHEMTHGVNSHTANLDAAGGESGGLNESNSDIHATMVKYYYWGANGAGSVVPDTTTHAPGGHNTPDVLWTIGAQLSTDGVTPFRWLYKPSKDGVSYDFWFDGCGLDDTHFSNGPGNRAFYFLSRGATPTGETSSAYLPAGMTGIGNDKAIKIWYNAMATKVTDTRTDLHAFRAAMLASANELFPGTGSASSPEVAAVKNAFAAINVGAAEGGTDHDHVTVTFPPYPNSPYNYKKIIVLPAMVPLALPAPTVANATNTTVTWSQGGLSSLVPIGGQLTDGKFLAPMASYGAFWPVKATSNQDPKQFAVDLIYGVSLDCDSDTETDACDMGAMALAFGGLDRSDGIYPAANLYGAWGTNDICVELFLEGFNNAFNR